MTGTGGRWVATAAALGVLGAAGAAEAQQRCAETEQVGSLGITGIACERCRFFTNGGYHSAVFWTEPEIVGMTEAARSAGGLREGDVLVAVDGRLITTRAGQERFSNLPRSGSVPVRVRRDGRTMEVSAPVTPVCRVEGQERMPALAGRPVPGAAAPTPPRAPGGGAVVAPAPLPPTPRVPAARAAPPSPAALAPLPPPPATPLPGVTLGFGFRCGACYRRTNGEETVWAFEDAPEVTGVQEDGPAWAAGLRPGDRIVAVDGVDLTAAAGGRRFGNIRAGDRVRWTVERDGRTLDVSFQAQPRPMAPMAPLSDVVRFTGRVGDALVEVRGASVTVVENEAGRYLVIRTADNEITIRVPGG